VKNGIDFLGIELIVADIDRALVLFVDLLGFEVHQRGASSLVAGEIAVVTDGRIAITLLEPTTEGTAQILPDRSPRLSQLILGADPAELDEITEAIVEAGIAMTPTSNGFFLKPEGISGILGIETAVVVTAEA
jgi:catechol 2,3-dioxygenase-like lactoylglutathione lyase family enzyme